MDAPPWLAHLTPHNQRFDTSGVDVAAHLNSRGPNHLRFEHSTEVLKALDYEQRVSSGVVPTRNLAHDWYNGLVWLRYPKAKAQINQLHVAHGQQAVVTGNRRTPLRDALTLMDESGAVLLTTDARLVQALLTHDWHTLFLDRSSWLHAVRLLIVGHGLLESMDKAHKGLCAKVIPVQVSNINLPAEEIDELLIELTLRLQGPGNFSPLPVMGVPAWFEESSAPGFYEDAGVFRAKPTHVKTRGAQRLAFRWDGTTLRS